MNKETKNHLYTKSYFIKRLIENKFFVTRIIQNYNKEDSRYWTILVTTAESKHILITCIKTENDFYFRLFGPNDINIKVETLSMNVIIQTIENILYGPDKLKITLD